MGFVLRSIVTALAVMTIHALPVSAAPGPVPDLPEPPVLAHAFDSLTSNDALAEYLRQLDDASPEADLAGIGESVQGQPLWALTLAANPPDSTRPTVLIVAQQHGDEPSGAEAVLWLARELTGQRRSLLDTLTVVLIPRLNPDGATEGSRRNADDADLNRDHVLLAQPETQALHAFARELRPEMVLDVHEYDPFGDDWVERGLVKDAQVTLGAMSNPNTDPDLRALAKAWIGRVEPRVEAEGFRFHEYIVGDPFGSSRMRFSTTDANDLRNGLAFLPALTLIQEGKQYGGLLNRLERRVRAQRSSLLALLEVAAEEAGRLDEAVRQARQREAHPAPGTRTALQYDYFPDSTDRVDLPVFSLYDWIEEERTFNSMHTQVRVKRSLPLPVGYLIEPGEAAVRTLAVLGRHGYGVGFFSNSKPVHVERVDLLHVTTMEEEEVTVPNVDVALRDTVISFPPHTVFIPIAQPGGRRLPVLLEAQSTRGLLNEYAAFEQVFSDWLVEGTVFPVYRVLEDPPANPDLESGTPSEEE